MSTALPEGWCAVAIAECVSPVPSTDPGAHPDKLFSYCDISSIDNETGKVVAPKRLLGVDAPSRARQAIRTGDVLFSTVRPGLRATAQVPDLQSPVGSTGFCVLRPAEGIDGTFLFQLVRSDQFVRAVLPLQRGVSYPAVRDVDVLSQSIPLPPAAEQIRIVVKLEELLSDLDAGVAELKAAQGKLAQYRHSLLKAAVEGALTASWREAQQARQQHTETGEQLLARILQERRARWEAKQLAKFKEQGKTPPKDWQKKYPEPVQPDITDLPALPVGWVWASGEQICEFITKGTTPPKDLDPAGQTEIPFLRVTNLTDRGALDLTDEVFISTQTHRGFLARSIVYPDDVLMNIVGPPLGQVALVPSNFPEWNINQAIAIFRAVDGVLPEFVCRYLLSPIAQQWLKKRSKTTAGQTNLTLEVCRALPFPLPPKAEQQEILSHLEKALESIAEQEIAMALALKQSTAQRQNLLRAAFSGQLVPQDPNDEPASVLLERIRAERAELAKQPKALKPKPSKEVPPVARKLKDVLTEAGDWISAQEAFRRCGVADGASTERIEELYAELRALEKAGQLTVEALTDEQGRKSSDKLKLLAG